MKSFLWITAVCCLFAAAFSSSYAFAEANPEGTKEIKETMPERQPAPTVAKEGKKYEWLEVRVSLGFQSDDNAVLLNKGKALVPEYDTSKLITTITLRATPIRDARWRAGAQYDFYNSSHEDVQYMELQTHSLLFFALYSKSPSYLYFPFSTNLYLLDHSTYLYTFRFSPTYYYEQSDRWLASMTLSTEILEYKKDADRAFDAKDYSVGFSETLLFSQKTWLKGTLSYNYLKAHEDYLSYSGPRAGLTFHTPLLWGIETTLSASLHYRDYRDKHPTTGVFRIDRRSVLDIYLTKPLKWGISVFARYTYIDNNSDEKNYDYGRNIFYIGLEWRY